MKMNISLNIVKASAIIVLALIMSCNNDKNKGVQLVKKIPVVNVIQMDVPIYNSYNGQMLGKNDIPIIARVEGFLESIEFQEGSRVTKGQLLYTIEPQSLKAASNSQRSKVVEAQTQLSKAKSDLNRIAPLAKQNAVSQSDLDAAQANYDAAVATLKSARSILESSNITLSYTKILSPIDGIIGKTNVRVGEFVGRNPEPLNTVSEIDSVIVEFFITEAQYIKVARRQISKIQNNEVSENKSPDVELELADGSVYKYKGSIDFIDRNINQSTGTLKVQATFPNSERLLRPGLSSKIKVQMDIVKDAIVIPQRCISEMQGQYSVFIVNDSNKIESRKITIERKAGDLAAVSKGLSVSDRIVIDALQKVKVGMLIEPVATEFSSKVFNIKQ